MPARILIIEDNDDFCEVLTYMLRPRGYTLLYAKSGPEGLEKAQAEMPDAIVSDIMLPRMNGFELCTMLKQDIRYRHIPIVLLSASKV